MSATVITKAQLAHLDRAERYLYINAIAKIYQINGLYPPLRLKDDDTILGQIYFNSLSRTNYLSTNVFLGKYDPRKIAAIVHRSPWQSMISLDECLLDDFTIDNSGIITSVEQQKNVPLNIDRIHRKQQIEFEKMFEWITEKEQEYILEKSKLAKQLMLEQFYTNNDYNKNSDNNNISNAVVKINEPDPIGYMIKFMPQDELQSTSPLSLPMNNFSTPLSFCTIPGCTACSDVNANSSKAYYNQFQQYPENAFPVSNNSNNSMGSSNNNSFTASVTDTSIASTSTTIATTFSEAPDNRCASLGTASSFSHGADTSYANVPDVTTAVVVSAVSSSPVSLSVGSDPNTTESLTFAVPVSAVITATTPPPQVGLPVPMEDVSATTVAVQATSTRKKAKNGGATSTVSRAGKKKQAHIKGKNSREQASKVIAAAARAKEMKKNKVGEKSKKTPRIHKLQNEVVSCSYAKKSDELIVVNTTVISLPVGLYQYDDDDEEDENDQEKVFKLDYGDKDGSYGEPQVAGYNNDSTKENRKFDLWHNNMQIFEMQVEQEIMKFDHLAFFPNETQVNEEGPWGTGVNPYDFTSCLYECQLS